jgi:hypothetical protein
MPRRAWVVALVLTGALGALPARAQEKDILAELEKRGKLKRDEKQPGRPVVEADLRGVKVTSKMLRAVASLKDLQKLALRATQVADVGLKELARLKGLHSLDLTMTKVTDAGLKELAHLKGLQELRLIFTKVTNVGVVALRKALPLCRIVR